MFNASKVEAPKGASKFPPVEPLEAGVYPGIFYQLIDLGLQKQEYQGEVKEPKIQLLTVYELLDEFMLDEEGNEDLTRPRLVSEDYPLNSLESDKAKSTIRYYGMDPKNEHGGDFSQLLGMPVMITLTATEGKNGKVYNNIAGVSAMRPKEASKVEGGVLDKVIFSATTPDMEVWGDLWKWVQDKIKDGIDYPGSDLEAQVNALGDDGKKETKKEKPAPKAEENSGDEDW